MTGYDRVSYPDKAHFSEPADGFAYSDSDDVLNGNTVKNGNGIYNDYTVDLKLSHYPETIRVGCFRFEKTRKCKFMAVAISLVLLISLILIIVAASSKSKSSPQSIPAVKKSYGLIAYGPDDSGKIRFNPTKSSTYLSYLHRLEDILHDYSTIKQMSDLDTYMICHDNTTSVPAGKTCMQTVVEFGDHCHHFDLYGIIEGRPCVLLVLKLEDDMMPKPFNISEGQNMDVHKILMDRYSNSSVGISCDGKTETDKKNIGVTKFLGEPVDYNPKEGFPLYYYKFRESKNHITPGVMVQFNDLPTNAETSVRCVAWAENFNNGEPQSSEIYTTEFSILIE